ncbi:hypothetical protein BH09ACT5_BH09ACT5_24760 [soil metagenome]
MRAHEAARTAADVLGIAFYAIDSEGARRGPVVVDPAAGTGAALDRKRRALEAHRTQVAVTGDRYALSSGDPRPIAAPESFTRLRDAGPSFSDYGLGQRILTLLVAGVLGLFAGTLLTAAHQATATVAGIAVPWGLVAGLVIVAALLVGLRIVFESRAVALAAGIGLLVAEGLLGLQSAGGSVLVADNVAGYVWTFGPVLIGTVVLAWPRLARRAAPGRQTPAAARSNIDAPARKGPDPT